MKQVSYDYCFLRDQLGMESGKILVSKDRATRMVSGRVSSCAIERGSHCLGDPALRSGFGTIGTRWPDHLDVRSGTSDRG